MAVAFSQHISGTHPQVGSPSTLVITLPSVANGDTIVAFFATTAGLGGLDSVSGCGATWTRLYDLRNNGFSGFTENECWLGTGVVAASGGAITATKAANVKIIGMALSFTGATQGAIDSTGVIDDTNTSTAALARITTPFETGQAVAVGFVIENPAGTTTVSSYTDSPGAFTTEDSVIDGTTNLCTIVDGYKITTGSGTYSRQANLSVAQRWTAFAVLLSADPFPSPPPPPNLVVAQKASLIRASSW